MQRQIGRVIAYSFYFLFFAVPLIFLPNTSELFEFNKIVLTYALTIIIVGLWLVRMVAEDRIIFRRTILDIPLLLFLASQILSTVFSIDPYTSFWGYYSRFNGGLLSTISYSALYWAFVSNLSPKQTIKSLYTLLASATLVSLYGVAEHYGIDKNLWVQDVQNRVFSTLGQPNWLATWLVGLLPITWVLWTTEKKWRWVVLSTLFFLVLIFTKSRSGFIGFGFTWALFWAPYEFKTALSEFIKTPQALLTRSLIHPIFLLLIVIFGSPWTPSLESRLIRLTNPPINQLTSTALETGGTESGEIRKIVWKGAIEIWKHYPILGTGVETFAYSYYNFRPVEHNMVSEWDFLYNKAHNEYLNLLANSGLVGLITFLSITATFFYFVAKIFWTEEIVNKTNSRHSTYNIAFLSGLAGMMASNFFGFSVVPVALLIFLFPAMAASLVTSDKPQVTRALNLSIAQKALIFTVLSVTCYLLLNTYRYWSADTIYAAGKLKNDLAEYRPAQQLLEKVTQSSPDNAIFWDELSQATGGLAIQKAENGAPQEATTLASQAVEESSKAVTLSPRNLNLYRNRASLFIQLSEVVPGYLLEATKTLEAAEKLAPTDAKIVYNLGLSYARTGQTDLAFQTLERAISLKPNYRNARFALALIVLDKGNKKRAIEELTYILEKIDPKDELARQQLEEIR